jgi:hypothetical protein
LPEAYFRNTVDASIPYAEPGMTGTVELADGNWMLRDASGTEYLLGAEASLAYAEPGMSGTVQLVDGRWVLRDSADVTYLIPAQPETIAGLPEAYFRNTVDASIPYAEPGMTGTVELADGYWMLRDSADVAHLIPFPPESISRLQEVVFRDSADTVIPYAEPGMHGTVALIEGYWVLKDDADTLYLLPSPHDALVRLQDAHVKDEAEADAEYANPDDFFYILTGEPRFSDRPEAMYSPPYIGPPLIALNSPRYTPESETQLRNIYDAILRIESAPDRPPEVIMDLGPIVRDRYTGDVADMNNASLLLIKTVSGGKYYLQIGLFDRREVLAQKLTDLNWAYPYALETAGTLQSPKYKLLVGPVNEGESNALLLRFKRYGYHDAFIRREG